MIKNLKIPEKRTGVLKSCLPLLEKRTDTKINFEEGSVRIEGEALKVWETKDVVKAIGRGFNPERAFSLLEGNVLYIINLKDYEKTDKGLKRVKSRIIGREGKTRNKIEEISGCMLSVYGKTVSIIAESEKISSVKTGIEMLINGSKHNKVYNYFHRCFHG
jgi:ribosomal RNA assembly protein